MFLSLTATAIFCLHQQWFDVLVLIANMAGIQLRRFCTPERSMKHPFAFAVFETALNACMPLWLLTEASSTPQSWPFKAVCFLAHFRLSTRIFISIAEQLVFEVFSNLCSSIGYGQEQRLVLIDAISTISKAMEDRGAVGLSFRATPIGQLGVRVPIDVQIDRLAPCVEVASNSSEGPCAVCCDRLYGSCRKLPCGHMFHSGCIDRWLRDPSKRTCPMCRARVELNDGSLDVASLVPSAPFLTIAAFAIQSFLNRQTIPTIPMTSVSEFFATRERAAAQEATQAAQEPEAQEAAQEAAVREAEAQEAAAEAEEEEGIARAVVEGLNQEHLMSIVSSIQRDRNAQIAMSLALEADADEDVPPPEDRQPDSVLRQRRHP